nr:immunoglobulin light chain junction region [Macaca mulatta]MOX79173.1 immunoglobulin light chain junction region [Macaca mulatta]MOX80262.1 immunoglobulin light chain junction region [Macaca mulatta]MOX81973.1 immunoglobulin light chain junction region [Macaca mulatta]MOX83316.1 immunoglobulin light chain junction region [Macaca mulatta]
DYYCCSYADNTFIF